MVRVRLILAFALVPVMSLAAAPPQRSALEALSIQLELEKKALEVDLKELERVSLKLGRAVEMAGRAVADQLRSLKDGERDVETIEDQEQRIIEAEAERSGFEQRRRVILARLLERQRRIVQYSEELSKRRADRKLLPDPVSGRWEVVINPGPLKGVFNLSLEGTLVSGEYLVSGDFRGSLRGTYVGDRVRLERIDAERGFDATFYGRLNVSQRKIVGTWEATALSSGGPSSGTWVAVLPEDSER